MITAMTRLRNIWINCRPPQRKTLDKPILDIRSGGVCMRISSGTCSPCMCPEPCKHNLGYHPIVEYEDV